MNLTVAPKLNASNANNISWPLCFVGLHSSIALFRLTAMALDEKSFSTRSWARLASCLRSVSVNVWTCSKYSTQRSSTSSTRYPVNSLLSYGTIVSVGPPVASARTGFPSLIASTGTIPKCSNEGVKNGLSLKKLSTSLRDASSRERSPTQGYTTLKDSVLRLLNSFSTVFFVNSELTSTLSANLIENSSIASNTNL
ncbi:hypothetical protein OGATHE_003135 [Ogataea polymorpha]|uniref:Uncharacterized protein n=1 Tax=Ogataea polymorpha TaxID=460523 RepID=A0A9P8P972_9ASCO|nr:hypothetical protein OGATHE_003135 [Ogataea polymorpha]